MPKLLGLPPDLYCRPLVYGLHHSAVFAVDLDVAAQNARKLGARDLSAAVLSPIEFGRDSSNYHIVRGIGVSSQDPTDTISLHFNESLETISTVAVNPSSVSEIILAKIILAEEFDVEPSIVPVMGSLEEMLRKADSALLVGDNARGQALHHPNNVDLVELWNDLTGLPYVHGFWCVREEELSDDELGALVAATREGARHISDIAREAALGSDNAVMLGEYLESFSYELGDEALDGLREFLHYAYYHGVLPDVAEVRFLPAPPEIDLPPISSN